MSLKFYFTEYFALLIISVYLTCNVPLTFVGKIFYFAYLNRFESSEFDEKFSFPKLSNNKYDSVSNEFCFKSERILTPTEWSALRRPRQLWSWGRKRRRTIRTKMDNNRNGHRRIRTKKDTSRNGHHRIRTKSGGRKWTSTEMEFSKRQSLIR